MLNTTRQFVKLLFEEEEKEESASYPVLDAGVSNKLSLGKPIQDAGLANMRYRSNASPSEAKEMLGDLGISKPSGSEWYESLQDLLEKASSGEMSVFMNSPSIVGSKSGKTGVYIPLKSRWKDDDKGGKRSFGFVRAVIMGARNAGYLSAVDSRVIKSLRIEQVSGRDGLIAYVGSSQSWGL